MAKKDDFDFETEGKGKFSLDLSFFTNLTKQQKGIILIAAVAVVLVIAIVITVVLVGANIDSGNDGTPGGITSGGDNDDNGENNNGNEDNDGDIDDDANPVQIYVADMPTKTSYYVGDSANYSGLVIGVMEENSSGFKLSYNEYPEKFEITGFDSSAPAEEQTITVKYREFTTTFTVEILPAPSSSADLVSISMKELPRTKFFIISGRLEAFNPEGGIILCEYSDGSTREVELQISNVSGYSYITTAGEYTLTIKYFDDNGGYAETTIDITVVEY